MEEAYKIFSESRDYFTWAFGIVNVLLGIFIYANRKRHQKELVSLKQSLDLDLERRKQVFEMKTQQYEDYFRNMDLIHNRHQQDYQKVVLPIINEFNSAYQHACTSGNMQAATEASVSFSEKIGKLTYDGFDELQVVRSQTNTLSLTASDKVAVLLDELQKLYEELFELSMKMVSDIVQITIQGDLELAENNQRRLNELSERTKQRANLLREEMRSDLKEI